MEETDPHTDKRRLQKLPVWIIEYVWTHKMMDIQEVVEPCDWPDVDSQPLSVDSDVWRLRVTSARIYCIVKKRHVEQFDRVMSFMDTTYTLLPRLVPPLKHMKIMFGLKTMFIMWMLREGGGTVDTLFKITRFFPTKLPQYEDQCNQHEMFLMRKNNVDFRTLAQALAMDKDKCKEYMKEQMETQYGERYAQKVEDRLLLYLQELEAALPGDTFIDQILRKSPVTEEEKLLVEVVTSDSATIAETVRKLLHCDAASCRVSQSEQEETAVATCRHSQSSQRRRGGDVTRSSEEHGSSSPQFCSRHQRWVKSILQQCPDECSEELLPHTRVSLSPPMFHSSPSTSSSQDLTPSDLVPCPPVQHRLPSQTDKDPPEQENPRDSQSSASLRESLLLPQPEDTDNVLPSLVSPLVQLVDVRTVKSSCFHVQPHQSPPRPLTPSSGCKRAASSPRSLTSPSPQPPKTGHSSSSLLDSVVPTEDRLQTAAVTHDSAALTSRETSAPPCTNVTTSSSSTSSSNACRVQLRLSLQSQAALLQSPLLQPSVTLTRLSAHDCQRATEGTSSARRLQDSSDQEVMSEDESSFDVNALYSSSSPGTESEDSLHSDPDYRARIKRKRLLSECETAWTHGVIYDQY